MKNQKGVSLITLVITIIVVIILAAIVLRGGAADTPGQAQFSGFASDVAAVQEAVNTAMVTAKGEEGIRGNSRTDSQLYNFVARGGYAAIEANESGDKAWLVIAKADAIPCTLINKQHAEASLGLKLPVRKVETSKGANQEVSYFVTPKGQVFCWPPYVYQDKSYVTGTITVSGDVKGTDSTKEGSTMEVTFPATGETVKISNSNTVPALEFTKDTDAADKVAVWYGAASTNAEVDRGVAQGYTFGTYDNTK